MLKHEFENLLRAGQRQEVERQLLSLNLSKVPREDALMIANVASRINRFDIALRILNPIVRDSKPAGDEAKPEEKIEYANCLRKLGAIAEAASILERIDVKAFPNVNFYLALCSFAQWQYQGALPRLKEYIASLETGSYAKKVGQVNYASALISVGAINEADELLKELYQDTLKSESRVLCANSLELRSQIEILYRKNYKVALSYLAEARSWLHDDKGNIANLFIRKWEAVAMSLHEQSVSRRLLDVREDSLKIKHWETARDCEYFIAEVNRNNDDLLNLYFGTPYESFRTKIAERNPDLLIPDTYLLGEKDAPVFDLRTACGDSMELNTGQMSHKLSILLTRDLHKPAPLLAIFSALFPDEYSNPFSSPNRIHQLIRQLRVQLEEAGIPLRVEQEDGAYRMKFAGPLRLCVSKAELPIDTQELNWLRLKIAMKTSVFTNKEAVEAVGVSRASMQRLIEWAVKNGHAVALAGGRSAKYQMVG